MCNPALNHAYTTVKLNDRVLAEAVTAHQSRDASGPSRGTTGFDARETAMYPGAATVAI